MLTQTPDWTGKPTLLLLHEEAQSVKGSTNLSLEVFWGTTRRKFSSVKDRESLYMFFFILDNPLHSVIQKEQSRAGKQHLPFFSQQLFPAVFFVDCDMEHHRKPWLSFALYNNSELITIHLFN